MSGTSKPSNPWLLEAVGNEGSGSSITLRDVFAGQAAAAIAGAVAAAGEDVDQAAKTIATSSYALADALLEARRS